MVPFIASAQAACPSLYRNLSQGMSGSDVASLQQFLIAQGHLASGNATGYFGRLTEAAVKSFQSANGIVSSGTPATTGYGAVGPKTRAVIAQKCSGTPQPPPPSQCPFFAVPIPGNVCPSGSYWSAMRDARGCQVGWQCTGGGYPPQPLPPPSQVSFSASPASGEAPLEVTFSGTVPESGTYYIDFGDDDDVRLDIDDCNAYGICTFERERHTYTEVDDYTARLQKAVPSCSTCNNLRGRQTLQSLGIDVMEETGTASISVSIPSTGLSVEAGAAMAVSWDSDFAPDDSKVRLEVWPASVTPSEGNNDRGVGSNSQLDTSDSLNWTIPPEEPCAADTGYATCLSLGVYKIVAKLYTGGTCWGYCASGTERTIHATAVSAPFTIVQHATSSSFSASPVSGATPLAVHFSGTVMSAGYSIDFGDGSGSGDIGCAHGGCPTSPSSSSVNVNHTYQTAGTYTAKLRQHFTTNAGNCAGVDCNVVGTVVIVVGGGGACAAPTSEMGVGDTDATTGGDVTRLQQFLKRDPAIYPEGLVTGYFGHATERAVKRFQDSKDIPQTGFVGPLTLDAIEAICGGTSSTPYAFAANPRSGTAPLAVNFTAKSASTTDDNIWYSVDFGDGEKENMSSDTGGTLRLSHTYESAGTFKALLFENESLCGLIGESIHGCTSSLEVDDATITVTGGGGTTPGVQGSCPAGFEFVSVSNTCVSTFETGFADLMPPGTPAAGGCAKGQFSSNGQCTNFCPMFHLPTTVVVQTQNYQGPWVLLGGRCFTLQEYYQQLNQPIITPPPSPWYWNSVGAGNALSALENALRGLQTWLSKQPQ